MSGPRMNIVPVNGNSRMPNSFSRISTLQRPVSAQHDDLIRFIHDSWSKVSQEVNRNSGNTVVYYHEQESERLKHFEPFNLEAYWGQRLSDITVPQQP